MNPQLKAAFAQMFGIDDGTYIVTADAARGELRLGLTVTDAHINAASTLDEGVVATIADNHTSQLIAAHVAVVQPDQPLVSVSVSLSVHVAGRIQPGTDIAIILRAAAGEGQPGASATFCDASDPRTVYATASHTKQPTGMGKL
ncbi:hypothetical protein GGF46_003535 [Coemansia sp. RSA 552]|nr:hypothetical protein GGF46_003535 [Coemansia sp. RSA 552]